MTKERLEEILKQRDEDPSQFKLYAFEYFEEALPLIRKSLNKEEPVKVEEHHEEPKKVVKKKKR